MSEVPLYAPTGPPFHEWIVHEIRGSGFRVRFRRVGLTMCSEVGVLGVRYRCVQVWSGRRKRLFRYHTLRAST